MMKFPLPKEPPSAHGPFKSCLPVPEVHIWSCSWARGNLTHFAAASIVFFLLNCYELIWWWNQ